MVNSDFPSNLKATNLTELIRQAKVYFVSELGKRLHAAGDFSFADVASLGSDLVDFDDLTLTNYLKRVEERLGNHFCSDYIQFLALEWLLRKITGLEEKLIGYFANQARRHLNTVGHLPPLATTATQGLQIVSQNSLLSDTGPFGEFFQKKWNVITTELSEALKSLVQFEELDRPNNSTDNKAHRTDFTSIALLAVASAQPTTSFLKYFSTIIGTRNYRNTQIAEDGQLSRMQNYLSRRNEVETDLRGQDNSQMWELARSHIFEGRLVDFVECVEQILNQSLQLLDKVQTYSTHASSNVKREQSLELECYLYVERLGAKLISLDEDIDAVQKLKKSLYDYALKAKVSALDMLDEEVQNMGQQIQKESLTRARLEVRLNDFEFPLSVAHKDWVLSEVQKYSLDGK